MTPQMHAILTVVVIGLISFLIGWLLTNSLWKRRYNKLKDKYNHFEEDYKILHRQNEEFKRDHAEVLQERDAYQRRVAALEEALDKEYTKKKILIQERDDYRTQLNDRKTTLSTSSTTAQDTKDELERIKKLYEWENKERMRIQGEYDKLNAHTNFSSNNGNGHTKVNNGSNKSSIKQKLGAIFQRIGIGNPNEKDDLTQINGIGPEISDKLNQLGIYSYKQIANLDKNDLATINDALEYFPGRAERDNWVGQAKVLLKQKNV